MNKRDLHRKHEQHGHAFGSTILAPTTSNSAGFASSIKQIQPKITTTTLKIAS